MWMNFLNVMMVYEFLSVVICDDLLASHHLRKVPTEAACQPWVVLSAGSCHLELQHSSHGCLQNRSKKQRRCRCLQDGADKQNWFVTSLTQAL